VPGRAVIKVVMT